MIELETKVRTGSSSDLARIGRHSLVYLPTVVVPAVTGILMVRILTTLFDSTQYGWYNLALSAIGFIKVFTAAWLVTSAVRFFAVYRTSSAMFVKTLATANLASSFVVCGIALLMTSVIYREPSSRGLLHVLRIAIAASVFTSLFEVLVVVFRAALLARTYSIYWVLYTALKAGIGLAVIVVLRTGIEGVFWGFLIAPALLLIPLYREMRQYLNGEPKIDVRALRTLAGYGFPLALTNLATWFLTLSDRYIIEHFRGATEVGYYAVGYAVPEKTLQFAFMTLMTAAYPVIVHHFENSGTRSTQSLVTDLTRYFFLLCGPVLALVIGMSKEFLLVLADSKFVPGSKAIPLVAVAMFLAGLNQLAVKGFELHKKSVAIGKISLTAGIANVALNLMLVPRLGYLGAAVSAMASYAFLLAMSTVLVRKYMAWNPPVGSIVRNVSAGITTVGALRAFLPTASPLLVRLTLGLALGTAVYFTVLLVLRELGKEDFLRLRKFLITLRSP